MFTTSALSYHFPRVNIARKNNKFLQEVNCNKMQIFHHKSIDDQHPYISLYWNDGTQKYMRFKIYNSSDLGKVVQWRLETSSNDNFKDFYHVDYPIISNDEHMELTCAISQLVINTKEWLQAEEDKVMCKYQTFRHIGKYAIFKYNGIWVLDRIASKNYISYIKSENKFLVSDTRDDRMRMSQYMDWCDVTRLEGQDNDHWITAIGRLVYLTNNC